MGLFGHGKGGESGCCAQYAIVPANAMYVLKTDLHPKYASLLEPFGVAYRCVDEVHVKNDNLLIIGCGPIGLAALAIANHLGATKVICIDVVQYRLDISEKVAKANNIKNFVTINATEKLNENNVDELIKKRYLSSHFYKF